MTERTTIGPPPCSDEPDGYLLSLGVPAGCPELVSNEASRMLTLTPREVGSLSPPERAEGAYVLFQYAFFLQVANNREQARALLEDHKWKRAAGGRMARTAGYSWEERKQVVLAGMQEAREADDRRAACEARAQSLAYLAARVRDMAACLQVTRERD